MATFTQAVQMQEARTENGMKALKSTSSACVDFFFAAGASRGKNIIPQFTAAYVEDKDIALRIALWLRDARGGSGERELFRSILKHLEKTDVEAAKALMAKVPELGRIDDLLVVQTPELKKIAFSMIGDMIRNGQRAKVLLTRIDSMTEEQCQAMLNSLN